MSCDVWTELPFYIYFFVFEFIGIFYACTMEDPTKRPSARKLVEILEENEENNKVVSSFGDDEHE